MAITELTAFFAMGLSLGMLHAFDPDHLAAVGGISSSNNQTLQHTWYYALHWSMGHGAALSAIALVVLLIGTMVPVQLSAAAEQCVALVLIAIGAHALWRLSKSNQTTAPRRAAGSASLVGLLHGTAGSAPLLALIPLSQINQPLVGLVYVLFFSAGVSIAMTGIGGAMSQVIRQLSRFEPIWQQSMQIALALFSLTLGIYLLFW